MSARSWKLSDYQATIDQMLLPNRCLYACLCTRSKVMALIRLCLLLGLALVATSADAQTGSPILGSDLLADADLLPNTCDDAGLNRIPVRCWVGLKFIILPKDRATRGKDYEDIDGTAPRYGHPAYDALAGKTVTVTKVEWREYSVSPNLNKWIVTFKSAENGPYYTASAVANVGEERDDAIVSCFALLEDLQTARNTYLGQSFWSLSPRLPALDENGQVIPAQYIAISKFEPTTIVDVLASPIATTPIRIVVRNDTGQEGYFDIAISQTNRARSVGNEAGIFSNMMSSQDPKSAHSWPDEVWKAIEGGKVFHGMTTEQVRLSLGDPSSVNGTSVGGRRREQWVYSDGRYLYFDDGLLTAENN
jgi:hypothetical protein